MTTKEKRLDSYRNLVLVSLVSYIIALVTNVIRVRSFGLIVVSYKLSDLVDAGYMNEVMMIPLYLAIAASVIATMTVKKDEPYFKISAFSSAILPIITFLAVVDAKKNIDNDITLESDFDFVISGSYDLGVLAIVVGVIFSFVAAVKFNTDEDQDRITPRSHRNVLQDPRYELPKSNYYQNPAPLQNRQTETIEVVEKNSFSTKFCSNCGSEIDEGNSFCQRCGVKVDD